MMIFFDSPLCKIWPCDYPVQGLGPIIVGLIIGFFLGRRARRTVGNP